VDRYKAVPEVRRILQQQHAPKIVKKELEMRHDRVKRERAKLVRMIRNSKPGAVPVVPDREKPILREEH
jgi:hypothetical protein